MKKYFRIYRQIVSINISRTLMYRFNTIAGGVISTAWGVFAIMISIILTSQTHDVLGWTADQIILLSVIYSLVIGLFHTLLSHNFAKMAQTIHFGELDSLLLKPVDSQFLLSTRFISVPTFFRFFAGTLFLVFFMWQRGITTTPWQVFSFVLIGICGIILMYSIWFTIATLLIWQSNVQNLIDLLGMITGLAKYPKEILRSLWGPIAAVLLPIILVVNTPTKAILGTVDLSDVLTVISLSLICLGISHLFWNVALHSYGSTSG